MGIRHEPAHTVIEISSRDQRHDRRCIDHRDRQLYDPGQDLGIDSDCHRRCDHGHGTDTPKLKRDKKYKPAERRTDKDQRQVAGFDMEDHGKPAAGQSGSDDLKDLDDANIGLAGSPTKIAKASDKVRKGAGEKVVPESPEEAVEYIVGKMKEKHVI